jgi:predicted Zn-dependent peptidase
MRRHASVAIVLLALLALPLAAQAPDRTKPPAPGAPPALRSPAIQKRTLSNGLPVWLVELHKVPVVQVTLTIAAGAGADPAGKFGVASLTAAMLDEGAGNRSSLEIADSLDYLGASLTTSSSFDASTIGLWVPVARLKDALPIAADVALRPTFPRDEMERMRKERLTALLQARDDPQSIAEIAFPRLLYGPDYRYGTSVVGTPETTARFTPDDLKSFYAAHYQPANATLIVVGDVTATSALPLLESAFGKWKAQVPATDAPPLTSPAQRTTREVFIIDKPGAPQSQIRIGWIGVARSTPDYFPLQVLNTILGGSFTSRLNQNLREQHGYTYGASSAFVMRAAAGPFAAAAGVQTDKTADALREFFNELNGILKPVPAEELAREKNYVALGFPAEFETTGSISGRLAEMVIYHLPGDYFANYVPRIQAVTAADVERMAQKYIQPGRFAVVVVGDRKAIEPAIRALNLGPVKVLSVDEAIGPKS